MLSFENEFQIWNLCLFVIVMSSLTTKVRGQGIRRVHFSLTTLWLLHQSDVTPLVCYMVTLSKLLLFSLLRQCFNYFVVASTHFFLVPVVVRKSDQNSKHC